MEPTTYVNQKLPDGTFFTGVGSTLIIFVVDQYGNEMQNVTLKEAATSPDSKVKQNPNPVGSDKNGNFTDLVGYGKSSDTKISSHDAIGILQDAVQNPHTRNSTQTLEISLGGKVVATAAYDRKLSNVDKDGNLRNYINPNTGRGMANYTIEISPVRFRLNQ